MRHYWRWRQLAHSIVGALMVIFTLASASYAIAVTDKHEGFGTRDKLTAHQYAGFVTLGLVLVTSSLGVARVLS